MYNMQSMPSTMDWSMVDFDFSKQNNILSGQYYADTNFNTEHVEDKVSTPPKTPVICSGPRLIPKVRVQDQVAEPATVAGKHRSQSSVSSTGFPVNYNPYMQHTDAARRSISPSASFQLLTPVSDTSPCLPMRGSSLGSPMSFNTTPSRPVVNHGRSISTSAVPTHTRNSSTSSIDGSVLQRFGYPTYRNVPHGTPVATRPRTASALSHLMPTAMLSSPRSSAANFYQSRPVTPPRAAQVAMASSLMTPSTQSPDSVRDNKLSPNLLYDDSFTASQNVTIQAYLSAPNPSPSLVQRLVEPARGQSMHYWYDIRNLRKWSDFTAQTIAALPDLLPLLQIPLSTTTLPTPKKGNPNPETLVQLHELLRDHFAVKVNAALKVCLGSNALEMRSLYSPASSSASLASQGDSTSHRSQPEFLGALPSDTEKTFDDMQRGRVVGIVRSYEQWNSGMRSQGPAAVVRYLASLSALHRFMREHGCRYGFLVTEIELVCVRYGGDGGSAMPDFGFLEVSEPIRLSTHSTAPASSSPPLSSGDQFGADAGQELQMTAALALFYLHLLAKSQPLPGQYSWKLDVGGPAALTRHKHKPRDTWMPQPNKSEKREAKRIRGWIWPDEPLSRRERGRGRRGR